jgi:hypothetical protein
MVAYSGGTDRRLQHHRRAGVGHIASQKIAKAAADANASVILSTMRIWRHRLVLPV